MELPSCYSFGFGVLTPEQICHEARRRGQRCVALLDRQNFYGLVRFLKAAQRQGIRPVAGMTLVQGRRPLCSAYVLDRRGFVRLNQIVSAASEADDADPLDNLLHHGWQGLALASEDPAVLRTLLSAGCQDLYLRLPWGRPCADRMARARSLGVPPLAVNPAICFDSAQAATANLLRAVACRSTLEQLPAGRRVCPAQGPAGRRQMESFFAPIPRALQTARDLFERAEAGRILARSPVLPRFGTLSEPESFALLRRLCERAGLRRYGSQKAGRAPAAAWRQRLEHELGVIGRRGFAGYFLLVREIVGRCSRTCGRGSAAASLVAYLLGITHVDPLRYDLDFERFLNDQRREPPDIDVDFPWDERDAVLRSVFLRYAGRSAMVADHVRFGPRSAMREAALALGLPQEEIGRVVSYYNNGELQRIPGYLRRAADALLGLPRHLGTHCGGLVITPGPISEHSHVQRSPLGYPLLAWDRESAAGAGLVKIDLLGNRSLSVLRDTLRLLPRSAPLPPRASCEPLSDRQTRAMIAAGDTLGLFYVESPASRQLLRKMRRGDFEHLIVAGSIIRPAANATIRSYLQRLHGAAYRSPCPVLERSYGLMIYQEDIRRVTEAVAGFSPGEAEQLRKTLAGGVHGCGSWEAQQWRTLFFQRGEGRGTPRATLDRLWRMIESFRGYSFCRSHSASYARVSARLALLKCHHPREFFLAVINNGGGYYSRQTYLNHCRRLGIPLLLPDVNRSAMAYRLDRGGIRVGLAQLQRLGRPFLLRLLGERTGGGAFRDLGDFLQRIGPGHLEMRILVRSGALDGIEPGMVRPQILWVCLRRHRGGELFPRRVPHLGDYPRELKALDELRTLGLMVSCHPVSLFRPRAEQRVRAGGLPPLIRSGQLAECPGREVSLVGLVAAGKEALTRSRDAMVFITLEDEEDLFETVFFPPVFARYRHAVEGGGLLLVCGRVEREMGAISVAVRRLSRLRS